MTNSELIPPSRVALAEALSLSAEILRNIELSELPLTNIALKTSRLARLLNDFEFQKIMEYEVSGYPTATTGVPPESWQLAKIAGRIFEKEDNKTKVVNQWMYLESISQLEESLKVSEAALAAARDPDISVASANPNQYVNAGILNRDERLGIRRSVSETSQKLASRRSMIYEYALKKHYELKFSDTADDIFTRIRQRVDAKMGEYVPDALQKIAAVYDGLLSENPENWSNAVHSCRRILQDLADRLFPPIADDRVVEVEGKTNKIMLGKDQYINRLIAFVQDSAESDRFEEIVGSQLAFLGDRLDSTFKAAQKGSHDKIVSKDEADRYVVYTYLLVGDILSLADRSRK
jgi:hypothetical protein